MCCRRSELAIHSEVIQDEKDLLVNYRQTSRINMDRNVLFLI